MRTFWILYRRETGAYFLSPIYFVLGTIFLLIMGFMFVLLVQELSQNPREQAIMSYFYNMFWLPGLIMPAIITMKLFAEENKSGTMEMLMTAPVQDWQVVLAKFFSALSVYACLWLPVIGYALILRSVTSNPQGLDMGAVAVGFVGVISNSAILIAAGTLASALTRNQIISAIIATKVSFIVFFIPTWIRYFVQTGPIGDLMYYLSVFEHMTEFSRGVINVKPVVLYLSLTFYLLYATVRIVESRKWK